MSPVVVKEQIQRNCPEESPRKQPEDREQSLILQGLFTDREHQHHFGVFRSVSPLLFPDNPSSPAPQHSACSV